MARHNKILSPGIEAPKDTIDEFLQEVKKAKALNHPHIVQVLDCGYANGCFFFLLEHFHNKTLADLIKRKGGSLSIDEAKGIIYPLLDALEYGQKMGLVHGAIQPQKVLFTNVKQKLTVKLADYGISAALGRGGFSNFVPPNNQYTSRLAFIPRQQALDPDYAQPDADVWATAAILYYVLTGEYPRDFKEQNTRKVVLEMALISILKQNKNIPQKLVQTVDIALIDSPQMVYKN